MDTHTKSAKKGIEFSANDFIERYWEEGWIYIKTVVDVVREPVLILDKKLCVIAANDPFYRLFEVKAKETEKKLVYKLGNGQWDIPALRKLLEDILPMNTFFKGFEVSHKFPVIGHKIMMLNARQIHFKEDVKTKNSSIILLAMEDITSVMNVAKKLADHTNEFEASFMARTHKMELHIKKLEKEMTDLKNKR